MNILNYLFPCRQVKKLQTEVDSLKQEVQKRQEAINKTNAYWKKKFHENRLKK